MKTYLGAALLAAGIALSAPATAAAFYEVESNDTLATANNIDGYFSLDANPDIADATTIPHVTVHGVSEQNGYDAFSFTVTTAGSLGRFDIDYAYDYVDSFLDAFVRLFDSNGNSLAANDDSWTGNGAGGSVTGLDSFLNFTFATPGIYTIRVGSCCEQSFQNYGPNYGQPGSYQLQVSLENGISEVPEPATVGLLGLGLIGIAARRRKAA